MIAHDLRVRELHERAICTEAGDMLRYCALPLLFVIAGLGGRAPIMVHGAEPPTQSPNPVIAEFRIPRGDDVPLVLVEALGQELKFLVGVGTSATCLHPRHRDLLGRARTVARGLGPNGKDRNFELFDAPPIRIGSASPKIKLVTVVDELSRSEARCAQRIDGILGMDVLENYVLRLDFGGGSLQLLQSVPDDAGEQRPLVYHAERTPMLEFAIGRGPPTLFELSTASTTSVRLAPSTAERLRNEGTIKFLYEGLTEVQMGGDWIGGVVGHVQMGRFAHRQILVEPGASDSLGLGYLSRYVVTFDFPRRIAFFKEGGAYGSADSPDCSGLGIDRVDGKLNVDHVWAGSPASEAGVLERDVIVQVNGQAIDGWPLSRLRRLWRNAGRSISLVIARDNRRLNFSFVLRDYHNSDAESARYTSDRAAERRTRSEEPAIQAELDVPPGGDVLVLPIELKGVERPVSILVDTGSSSSLWDVRLQAKLGAALGPFEVNHAELPRVGTLARIPAATLGGVPLSIETTGVITELRALREATGYDIDGVIGMSFFRRHVVQIDFDSGKFRILSAVPDRSGNKREIEYTPAGTPAILCAVGRLKPQWFRLDTGSVLSAAVSKSVFDELHALGQIDAVVPILNGRSPESIGRSDALDVGPFRHTNTRVMSTASSINGLGLGYLSRYTVTLDFPARAAYLKEGKRYYQVDRADGSGLWLCRRDAGCVVGHITLGGPADDAGFEVGDSIQSVNGHNATELSLFEIRELFKHHGRVASVIVQRGNRDLKLALSLRDPSPRTAKTAAGGRN